MKTTKKQIFNNFSSLVVSGVEKSRRVPLGAANANHVVLEFARGDFKESVVSMKNLKQLNEQAIEMADYRIKMFRKLAAEAQKHKYKVMYIKDANRWQFLKADLLDQMKGVK